MAPIVSVVIPTLDGSLPEGVETLRSCPDIELVVVKSLSPVGRARNEGLRRAQGEYVAWVDADDEITHDWPRQVLNAIAGRADCAVIDVKSETHGRIFHWRASGLGLFADMLSGSVICAMYAFVIKRELYRHLSFDETRRQSEDARVLSELLPRVKSAVSAGCVYHYRYHESSLVHTSSLADELDAFNLAVSWAHKWRNTATGEIAFAYACREAGWMYEWKGLYRETRAYLRSNFFRALACRHLNLAWKVKIILILLGLVKCLRPVYYLNSKLKKLS